MLTVFKVPNPGLSIFSLSMYTGDFYFLTFHSCFLPAPFKIIETNDPLTPLFFAPHVTDESLNLCLTSVWMNRWFKFDDAAVTRVRKQDLNTSRAYILFYKKATSQLPTQPSIPLSPPSRLPQHLKSPPQHHPSSSNLTKRSRNEEGGNPKKGKKEDDDHERIFVSPIQHPTPPPLWPPDPPTLPSQQPPSAFSTITQDVVSDRSSSDVSEHA